MGSDQDQAVSTNTKLSVTKESDKAQIAKIPACKTVVYHHKIIACALVLEKGSFLRSAHHLKVSKSIRIIRNNASSLACLLKTADNQKIYFSINHKVTHLSEKEPHTSSCHYYKVSIYFL